MQKEWWFSAPDIVRAVNDEVDRLSTIHIIMNKPTKILRQLH